MTFSTWLAIHFGPKQDWDWLWIELRITPDIEAVMQQVLDGNITFMDALALCAAKLYAVVTVDELLARVGELTEANLAEALRKDLRDIDRLGAGLARVARWFTGGR